MRIRKTFNNGKGRSAIRLLTCELVLRSQSVKYCASLETGGKCFFCRDDLEESSSDKHNNKTYHPLLQFHYLGLDSKEVIKEAAEGEWMTLPNSRCAPGFMRPLIKAKLCPQCQDINEIFSELYKKLEIVQMKEAEQKQNSKICASSGRSASMKVPNNVKRNSNNSRDIKNRLKLRMEECLEKILDRLSPKERKSLNQEADKMLISKGKSRSQEPESSSSNNTKVFHEIREKLLIKFSSKQLFQQRMSIDLGTKLRVTSSSTGNIKGSSSAGNSDGGAGGGSNIDVDGKELKSTEKHASQKIASEKLANYPPFPSRQAPSTTIHPLPSSITLPDGDDDDKEDKKAEEKERETDSPQCIYYSNDSPPVFDYREICAVINQDEISLAEMTGKEVEGDVDVETEMD